MIGQIGELFISLGIKGATSTISSLTGIEKGLGGAGSEALFLKNSIMSVFDSLKQATFGTQNFQTNIRNLATLSGVAAGEIENLDKSFQRLGAGKGEFATTLGNLLQISAGITRGNVPREFGIFNNLLQQFGLKGISVEQVAKDPMLIFKKLMQVAPMVYKRRNPLDLENINEIFNAFGVQSQAIRASLLRGEVGPELNRVPVLSPNERGNLNKFRREYVTIQQEWEVMFQKEGANLIPQVIPIIKDISASLLELVKALMELGKVSGAFDFLKSIFEFIAGLARMITFVVNQIMTIGQQPGGFDVLKKIFGFIGKIFKAITSEAELMGDINSVIKPIKELGKSIKDNVTGVVPEAKKDLINILPASPVVPAPVAGKQQGNNVSINQDIYFNYEEKDFGQAANDIGNHMVRTAKQFFSQATQVT